MDAAKAKETVAAAAAQGQKVIQDILAHPQVAAATKKIVENQHVQKALNDPRVAAAVAKASDPAVQRHILSDLSAILHGEMPIKDAIGDLKAVLTDAHVEQAKADGSH